MRPAHAVIGVSLAVVLAGIGLVHRQLAELEGMRVSLAGARSHAANAGGELDRLERRQAAQARRAEAAAAPAPRPAHYTPEQAIERRRAMNRAALDVHLRAFFEKFNLSPAQIEQAEQYALAHNERKDDISAGARGQGLALTEGGVAAMRRAEMTQFRGELSALIGQDGVDQYFQAEHLEPAADLVGEVVGNPYGAGSSITPAQAAQLTQLIGAASPTAQKGGTVHTDEIDWDVVLAQARKMLSPPQFEAFAAVADETVNRAATAKVARTLAAKAAQPQP